MAQRTQSSKTLKKMHLVKYIILTLCSDVPQLHEICTTSEENNALNPLAGLINYVYVLG